VRLHNLNDGDVVSIGKHDLLYVDERARTGTGDTGRHAATTVLYDEDVPAASGGAPANP
jgi:hypothetical protein